MLNDDSNGETVNGLQLYFSFEVFIPVVFQYYNIIVSVNHSYSDEKELPWDFPPAHQ